jgi:hypothetical protein
VLLQLPAVGLQLLRQLLVLLLRVLCLLLLRI